MNEMIKMVVVLTILTAFSGGLLAAVKEGTKEKIELQELKFVKGPAIKAILKGAENDPLTDRFKIKDGKTEYSIFVGKFNGKANTIALESAATGFGGPVGVMVGINVDRDEVVGVGVTTSSETPGLGARAKSDPSFVAQFKGNTIKEPFKVSKDGGKINALSGATITSRAVCEATTNVAALYKKLKPEIQKKLAAIK
ncbi:MAG: electron transporter RnfG [Deltaproteobacteria bacterium]|nr:MAG: electron transporter RnfG [Deltaproteobacteria bacterium]